jgi:hypothetical protein
MEFDVEQIGESSLAVTVEEQKLYSRVDGDDEDEMIEMLIRGVTQEAEDITHRLFPQRMMIVRCVCDGSPVTLPVMPVASINSVKIDGEAIDRNLYTASLPSSTGRHIRPAVIEPLDGFPKEGRMEIAVTAGTPKIPTPVLIWIKTRVSTLYEQRESHAMFNTGLKFTELGRDYALALLDPYIIHGGF